MKHTPESLGQLVKKTRRALGISQRDLALSSATGLRFLVELEKGKPTAHLGKVLNVLQTLGITIELVPPVEDSIQAPKERKK